MRIVRHPRQTSEAAAVGTARLGHVAFTLIEVLLAVGIFAIILLAINGVFYGALRLRAKTAKMTDELLPVDRALGIIKRDLANVVLPNSNGLFSGALNSANSAGLVKGLDTSLNQPIQLEVYSASGTLSDDVPWADIQKIDYWLQDPTNRADALGKDLIRSVTRNLLATANDQPEQRALMGNVQSLQFSFYDGTNWIDTWDSTINPGLPTAVKMALKQVSGDAENKRLSPIELVVSIARQWPTNEVDSADTESSEGAENGGTE